MKCLLVFQFASDDGIDLDRVVSLEKIIADVLAGSAKVDGHDWGAGEMNIFIITAKPLDTFERCKMPLYAASLISKVRVAYRCLDGDDYTCLWPEGLEEFSVS